MRVNLSIAYIRKKNSSKQEIKQGLIRMKRLEIILYIICVSEIITDAFVLLLKKQNQTYAIVDSSISLLYGTFKIYLACYFTSMGKDLIRIFSSV